MGIQTAEQRRAELEAELPNIVDRLRSIGARKIVLFGSLARGDVWRGSDIDLLVVLDRPGRFIDRLDIVYRAMAARVGVDAIVYTSEEFAELAQTRPFVRDALAHGRVLYEDQADSGAPLAGRSAGRMRPDPRAEGQRWLAQAARDLDVARLLADNDQHNAACFHAQQGAEKALKGLLYASGEDRVTGHSVGDLAKRAAERWASLKELIAAAKRLDLFYIPTRYPNALPGGIPAEAYGAEESTRALADARMILEACRAAAERA